MKNLSDLPELVTVLDTMAFLQMGRSKVYSLIGAGHLEIVRFGQRCTRVKRSSIERLVSTGFAA
jgi:hypothetical protein